jgi:hypothetical protein
MEIVQTNGMEVRIKERNSNACSLLFVGGMRFSVNASFKTHSRVHQFVGNTTDSGQDEPINLI